MLFFEKIIYKLPNYFLTLLNLIKSIFEINLQNMSTQTRNLKKMLGNPKITFVLGKYLPKFQ